MTGDMKCANVVLGINFVVTDRKPGAGECSHLLKAELFEFASLLRPCREVHDETELVRVQRTDRPVTVVNEKASDAPPVAPPSDIKRHLLTCP